MKKTKLYILITILMLIVASIFGIFINKDNVVYAHSYASGYVEYLNENLNESGEVRLGNYSTYSNWSTYINNHNSFTIENIDGLRCLSSLVSKDGYDFAGKIIYLSKDLTFNSTSGFEIESIGTKDNPFKGTFNGNGHKISGASIVRKNYGFSQDGLGLFGVIDNALIKNVILEGAYMDCKYDVNADAYRYEYNGILVGKATKSQILDSSIIDSSIEINCSANDPILKASSLSVMDISISQVCYGGVVGYATNCDIINCTFTGNMYIKENSESAFYVGGILGHGYGSLTVLEDNGKKYPIRQCYVYLNLVYLGNYQFFDNGNGKNKNNRPAFGPITHMWFEAEDVSDGLFGNVPDDFLAYTKYYSIHTLSFATYHEIEYMDFSTIDKKEKIRYFDINAHEYCFSGSNVTETTKTSMAVCTRYAYANNYPYSDEGTDGEYSDLYNSFRRQWQFDENHIYKVSNKIEVIEMAYWWLGECNSSYNKYLYYKGNDSTFLNPGDKNYAEKFLYIYDINNSYGATEIWNMDAVYFNANGGTFIDGSICKHLERYADGFPILNKFKEQFKNDITSIDIKKIGTPTRDGYTFAGWATSKDSTTVISNDEILKMDSGTLYAVWGGRELATVTVNRFNNGNKEYTQTYSAGQYWQTGVEIGATAWPGYEFSSIETSATFKGTLTTVKEGTTYKYNFDFDIYGYDDVINIKYTAIKYTLTIQPTNTSAFTDAAATSQVSTIKKNLSSIKYDETNKNFTLQYTVKEKVDLGNYFGDGAWGNILSGTNYYFAGYYSSKDCTGAKITTWGPNVSSDITLYALIKEKPTDITAVLHYNNSQFYVSNSLETSERDESCTKTITISRTNVLNSLKPYNLRETYYENGKPEHGNYFWGWTTTDYGCNVASPKMISKYWVTNDTNISGDTAHFYAVWSTTPITMHVKYDSTLVTSAPSITNNTYSDANPIWTDDEAGNIEIWANYGEQVTVGGLTLKADASVSYKFSGWDVGGDETEDTKYSEGVITFGRGELTLTAIFEDKGDIVVTLDYNGGTYNGETKSTITRKPDSIYGILPTPEMDNYDFIGWYPARYGGAEITSSTTVKNEDHTLYAHWLNPNEQIDVTFYLAKSSINCIKGPLEIYVDGKIGAYLDFINDAEETDKWSLRIIRGFPAHSKLVFDYETRFMYNGCTINWKIDWENSNSCVITRDLTYEVSVSFTITFPKDLIVRFEDYNYNSKDPENASRTESSSGFCYFYYDYKFNDLRYPDLSQIEGSRVNYPYNKAVFDLIFDNNDLIPSYADEHGMSGGYIFQGYYFNSDYSGERVTGDTLTKNQVKGKDPTENIYLYAKWVPANMTVTMDAKGGTIGTSENWTGSGSTATKVVKYGDTLGTLPSPETSTMSRSHYAFAGWYYDEGFTQPVSESDDFKEKIGAGENEITIYAKWVNYEYTVEYNANDDYMSSLIKGGESVHVGNMEDSTFLTNTYYNLSENIYTRAYYTFAGWNTSANGSGTSHADKASVYNMAGDGVRNITLYAQWVRISYDIELKIAPSGHGHLVVTIDDYQEGKYVSPISTDGTCSVNTAYGNINGVLKEVVELTITEDTVITTYAGNTITVTAVDQTDVIASGAFRDSKKDYLGYLFTDYQTTLNNSVSDKVLTLPYINTGGTVTATYGIVQYTMALSAVYGDEKASTVTSGKLAVNPALSVQDTVTLSLSSPAVTAKYIANIGYIRAIDDGTCWYYYYNGSIQHELSNDTDTFEYVLTTDELIAYYDKMGELNGYNSEAFAQKTQNLADVYINTRKMVIDLTFTYVDIYNADTESSELANSISITTTVDEIDVTTVSLDDILLFTVTDVNNYYKFYRWVLKTASGGEYYEVWTTEEREIKISTNVIKFCATDLASGESGHDAKLVFEISMYRPILVMVDTDSNVIKGGVYSHYRYYRNYNALYGETLHFGFVLRSGYELTGIRYKTKSYTDSDWSEYTSVSVTDGELTLDVTADMYEIEPTYDSLTFTVDIKVYVGNTPYTYSEWTDVDLLTCRVTPGENYPRYDGYFTLAYELKDTANYSMVGLFAGLGGAQGTAIYTGQTYSAMRAIKDGYEFSIVLSPISDTVVVCAIQSESDLVNGRWTQTENPAEYSLQSGTVSDKILTLSTGDEFTLNYDTYKGYNIVGYKLNNGEITYLTQRSGSIPFVYSSETKGTYYLIFSKVQYTLIVANDDTKGEYTADKETIYINQTFNLSGTDYTGYKNVGFVANTVEFEQMADVTVTSDMILDDTTDVLTITPKYIAQYTVSLDIYHKHLASSVLTYIDDEESDFSRYYDEGSTVKIELVTDLDHEIAEYTGITGSEISVVPDVENDTKTYTISFHLYSNRHINLTLDGVEHVITVYNAMASGSVTFNTADISDSDITTLDDRYEVTVRHGETLGMLVTAYAGYRYDGITADEDEFTVPFEVTSDQTLTVHYVKTYILTTAVAGIGSGTITDGGEYDAGTTLTVTATPDTGYYLSKWVVNGVDVDASREYTFEINEHTTVTAYFEYIEYTFDTSALESYYVVNFADSKESYHFGDTADITLTVRPTVHFELRKILVNNVPYSTETVDNAIHMSLKVNYVNFNSDNKCVITASVYMLYSVVVEIDNMYKDLVSILAENVYTHLDGSYEYILRSNGRMTIAVTGSEYFTFDHMDINGVSSTANPYYLRDLTENKTISVVMNKTSAKISVVAKTLLDGEYVDNTEIIDVTAPETALVYDEVTVTINADIVGYRFEYFYYGEILDLTDDSSTFVVDRPSTCEVYAVFSYLDYVVLYSEGEHYTVTSTTSTTAHKYDTLTMTISPDSGYQVVGWVYNGENIDSTENEYSCVFEPTDNNVSTAYIIAPIVEKIKYTVTATTNNTATYRRGTVSITYNDTTIVPTEETPNPTVDVEYGDSVTLTATVNDDSKYRFIRWMYNDEFYSDSETITVKNMNENKAGEYEAWFSTATDTITVQVTPDQAYAGRITKYVNGEQTTDFKNGDTVTMSIDESRITTGYAFVGWHINELKPSPEYTTTELTITLTKDNRVLGGVIYAQFAPRDYKIAIDWSAGGAVDYSNKDGSVNGYQPSTDVYDMYDELTLNISSDAGYRIGNIVITNGVNTVTISDYVNSIYGVWTLDFNTILNIYSEEITTIYVNFEIMHFDIVTSLVITNGDHYADAMILPEPTTVDYGQSFDISTVLAEGFNFVGWYVGDTMITNIKDYTLSASYIYNMYVEENGRNVLYLVAKCEYIVYDLQDNFVKRLIEDGNIVVPSITPGVITISQDGMYRLNDVISMSVTASTGYRLVGIYVDGELVTNESTYTTIFAVDMQDSIFEARFEKILVTISVTAVSTDGSILADHGDIWILDGDVVGNGFYYQDTVTILASANYGYTFAKYNVLGIDHTGSHYQYMDKDYLAYTFVISDAHMDALTNGTLDVQAIYQIMVFTITFESNMSADSISLGILYNGEQYTHSVQAQYNTEVTLTAVCSDNLFKLLGIYLGDEWLSGNEEYSFTVKRNMNIVAKFGPVISFANFTDPEQRLYEREYNFAEQRLEIGTDILCHPNYINDLVVNYEKLDAGIVDPINAGEYIVTVKIRSAEYADFISDPVRLRINKYALNVEMTDAVTKTYDGTCNVSKSTLESLLVLNGLPAEHADATALDFESVIAKLMKNNLEYKKVATGLDLKVTGLTLTDSDNFYIIDTDGYLMFNACGSITPKVLTLQGVTILNKVYDGTDIAMVSSDTTPYIMSSEIITDDQLSLDVDNIIYRYEDAEVGSNKRVRGEAGLLGLARENYRLEIFDQTANIHPYEISTTVGGVTYTVTDTNRDVFLPIDGALDVTVYESNTAKYRELYAVIDGIVNRRNKFLVAYDIVIMSDSGVFVPAKPIQVTFALPFKADSRVHSYLVNTQYQSLVNAVDNNTISITATDMVSIAITKEREFLPTWLIILIISAGTVLLAGGVTIIVVIAKRRQRTTLLRESMRFSDF